MTRKRDMVKIVHLKRRSDGFSGGFPVCSDKMYLGPEKLTSNPLQVNCSNCQRTKAFKAAL